jgi:hypothetical protein
MQIPSYQMHNVLKVYSRQLSENKPQPQTRSSGRKTGEGDRITISAEGKRKAIIDRVAADVVDRITRYGPREDLDHEVLNRLRIEAGSEAESSPADSGQFVFNVIGDDDRKQTSSLPLETSDFLTQRLEELAKEAVEKKLG